MISSGPLTPLVPNSAYYDQDKAYVYSWEEEGFTPKYKSFEDLSLTRADILSAMPEFVSSVFPGAQYNAEANTVTIDGTVFDLNNQVRCASLGAVCGRVRA